MKRARQKLLQKKKERAHLRQHPRLYNTYKAKDAERKRRGNIASSLRAKEVLRLRQRLAANETQMKELKQTCLRKVAQAQADCDKAVERAWQDGENKGKIVAHYRSLWLSLPVSRRREILRQCRRKAMAGKYATWWDPDLDGRGHEDRFD
jgi:hypothetical protein